MSGQSPLNIVFDFGGVLFDWRPHDFLARLLPHRAPHTVAARALAADFFQGYGGDWAEFDRGTVEPSALAERIAARTGLTPAEVATVIDAVPAELAPVAGTVELLQKLHESGRPVYFLSNMPAPYAEHLESNHDFVGWFRGGVFSSRVQMIKPEPGIYAHAAEAFGIAPAETLFIDDVPQNVAAARACGWQALHFESPAQCGRELARFGLL